MPLVYAPMPVNGDQTQSAQDCVVMTALPFTPTDYLIRAIRCASAQTLTFDTPLKTGRTAVFAAGETRNITATKITSSTGTVTDIEVMY